MTDRPLNATPAARVPKRTVVSKLQHGWLKAMGVDVPWVVTHEDSTAAAAPAKSSATPPTPIPTAQTTPASRPSPSSSPPRQKVVSVPTQPTAASLQDVNFEALDLAQLASAVHGCQRCGLCQGRQHAVPGTGVEKPTILIVGEAPGEQEDAQGLPFVGRSGELLDNMLKAIGHDRHATVYITNVVKCRPPANRNPRDEEIAACAPFLSRQIELLAPKAVLAMGRFAAHALLATDASLQQLRQTTHEIQSAGRSLPVVVTYHPAYLLRRPVDKRLAWEDLKRLRALIAQ